MNRFYLGRLAHEFGATWMRFWFSKANDRLAARMRIAIGIICLLWLYSFSTDVADWFGPKGVLRTQAIRNIESSSLLDSPASQWRFSLLDYCTTNSQVATFHLVAFGLAAAFTIGFATPFTSIATLVAVSSFVQRAPILFGAAEHLLLSAILYLCIAPCGKHLSLDALLSRRGKTADDLTPTASESRSVRSNIALRLIQIHLAIVLLYSGLTKLSGVVWWNGDAVWWMLVQPESALVDFSRLGADLYGELIMNAWTYAIVGTELIAATLIWFRLVRPLIITACVIVYLSLIPLTGLVGYCSIMIVLLFSFLHHSDSGDPKLCTA